jgi:hypothetical protein
LEDKKQKQVVDSQFCFPEQKANIRELFETNEANYGGFSRVITSSRIFIFQNTENYDLFCLA